MTASTAVDMDELDALLEKLGKRGFAWYSFRTDRHGPDVDAFVYRWKHCADVVVLADAEHAHAYRLPTERDTDVFAPDQVYWLYNGSPVWTLRAMLTLSAPGQPNAPSGLVPAPTGLGVPGNRTPVRTRRRGS